MSRERKRIIDLYTTVSIIPEPIGYKIRATVNGEEFVGSLSQLFNLIRNDVTESRKKMDSIDWDEVARRTEEIMKEQKG